MNKTINFRVYLLWRIHTGRAESKLERGSKHNHSCRINQPKRPCRPGWGIFWTAWKKLIFLWIQQRFGTTSLVGHFYKRPHFSNTTIILLPLQNLCSHHLIHNLLSWVDQNVPHLCNNEMYLIPVHAQGLFQYGRWNNFRQPNRMPFFSCPCRDCGENHVLFVTVRRLFWR